MRRPDLSGYDYDLALAHLERAARATTREEAHTWALAVYGVTKWHDGDRAAELSLRAAQYLLGLSNV